jgi:hypothetical protein
VQGLPRHPTNICGIVSHRRPTEPRPPFLDEIMARKKATVEELRRLNKAREFKRKRNMLKAAGAGPDNKVFRVYYFVMF